MNQPLNEPSMINPDFLNGLKSASTQKLTVEEYEGGPSTVRRRLESRTDSKVARLRLVSTDDGLLDWDEGGSAVPGLSKRRRGSGGATSGSGQLISFERIEPSKVGEMLEKQDLKFTPSRGIYGLKTDTSVEKAGFPDNGRVLLIIHGTFSNGDNFLNGFLKTDHGKLLLKDAARKYDKVLFFNHPTLSVSPVVNALDLNRAIGKSKAKIDIISHSRGGLVARWWCEAFDPDLVRCENAILVGSPLAGTGLAAPPNIRKTLKLLTNYGNSLGSMVGMATAAIPILGLVNTLLTIVTSVTSVAASTPIADALMAMVPGLNGQSRVGNSAELLRLHAYNGSADRYAAIKANFQSDNPGWKFWKYFSRGKLADTATDLIFTGDNDLVVDTESMTYLSSSLSVKRVFDFKTTNLVHHINYFEQPQTTAELRGWLGL